MKEFQRVLLKNARLIDPLSPHDGHRADVLLSDGKIEKIGNDLTAGNAEVVELDNLHVSPGWFDLRVNFRDPGNEHEEDLASGMEAALRAGFTGVGLSPDTDPVIDSKADIEYLLAKSATRPLSVYPYGAFTRGLSGEELSEMYDMYQSGAAAFSHGERPVKNAAVMNLALLYARPFAPFLQVSPLDPDLSTGGVVHEGPVSVELGLSGISTAAETIYLERDLHLADYAETGIHFCGISSADGVRVLRNAEREGRRGTADVALLNLLFRDTDLRSYDTNLKVLPPLRSEADRLALIEGLHDGTIGAITSNHQPQATEDKRCEFDLAAFGAAVMECFFGALWPALSGHFSLSELINFISHEPRKIAGVDLSIIEEGAEANLSLFDPNLQWSLNRENAFSKAYNNPLFGHQLQGKALGVVNKGIILLYS